MGPLLTSEVHQVLLEGIRTGQRSIQCSLDLKRTQTVVDADENGWSWQGQRYPYLERCKDRTVYYWTGTAFEPVARFTTGLIKLIPTDWGPPTFEIDGIKMLPTAKVSPYADAERKVGLIQPRDKIILDTCGGLGYYAAWCLAGQAAQVRSYEKNPDVIWLRSLNPWSPQITNKQTEEPLALTQGDISQHIAALANSAFDAVLHDPPRFGIAGELYSQSFYDHLSRVLRPKGRLFHYTGTPNKLTSGRDVPNEVSTRLKHAGFKTELNGDGVLAVKR